MRDAPVNAGRSNDGAFSPTSEEGPLIERPLPARSFESLDPEHAVVGSTARAPMISQKVPRRMRQAGRI